MQVAPMTPTGLVVMHSPSEKVYYITYMGIRKIARPYCGPFCGRDSAESEVRRLRQSGYSVPYAPGLRFGDLP